MKKIDGNKAMAVASEQQKTEPSRERLFYIDALRGFAILLVVIGHIPQYIFYHGYEEAIRHSHYLAFVSSFHMPLFMMVSGYVMNLDRLKPLNRLKLLIPFFIFGLLYALCFESTLMGFFLSPYKYGYWYLPVLVFFVFLLSFIKCCQMNLYLGMVAVQAVLSIGSYYLSPTICNLFSLNPCSGLWIFFCLGVILRRSDVVSFRYKGVIGFVGTATFVMGYLIEKTQHVPGLHWLTAISACVAILLLFVQLDQSVSNTRLRTMMSTVGKHTLQIYTLHYFVMSIVSQQWIGELLVHQHLTWMEWWASPVLALTIAYICIGMTWGLKLVRLDFVFAR